jgi:transposase
MEVIQDSTLENFQCAALSEDQAEAIFEQSRDAVTLVLLELSKQLTEACGPQATPSTPSGMIPVYEKPTTKSRKKRPGAKQDHPGSWRRVPNRIDRRETHKLPYCLECGGRLKRTGDTRTRYIKEIPEIQTKCSSTRSTAIGAANARNARGQS